MHDFAEFTERDLKILFTGSYQAVSYVAEIIDEDNINLQYVKSAENILKVEVRSRPINAKTYCCFIEYHPNTDGISGISHYSCDYANADVQLVTMPI